MKKIKSFGQFKQVQESYKFLNYIEFTDYEIGKLEEVEKTFNSLPKEDLEDCALELENIGENFRGSILTPILWEGEELTTRKAYTSDIKEFTFYATGDFYYNTSDNIFSKKTIKLINAELLNSLVLKRSENELRDIFSNEIIRGHFNDSIKIEAENFNTLITNGWIPCFAITKLSSLKNWTIDQNKVDTLFEFKEKINGICQYEMVLAPSKNEPSIILVDKKYISRL